MAIIISGRLHIRNLIYSKSTLTSPVWITPMGSLGIFNVGQSVSIQLIATDSTSLKYSLVPGYGSLPNNLSLTPTGIISGILSSLSTTTIFGNIKIRATNINGLYSDNTFSITVDDVIGLTCDTTLVTLDSTDNIASLSAII